MSGCDGSHGREGDGSVNESRRDSWETRPSGLETDPTVAGRAMLWRPRLWVCARAREGAERAGTRRDETRSTSNIGGRGDGGGRQSAQTHSVVAGLRERSQTTPASPAPCWHTTFAATLLSVAARTRQRRPVPTARRVPHRHSGSPALWDRTHQVATLFGSALAAFWCIVPACAGHRRLSK